MVAEGGRVESAADRQPQGLVSRRERRACQHRRLSGTALEYPIDFVGMSHQLAQPGPDRSQGSDSQLGERRLERAETLPGEFAQHLQRLASGPRRTDSDEVLRLRPRLEPYASLRQEFGTGIGLVAFVCEGIPGEGGVGEKY